MKKNLTGIIFILFSFVQIQAQTIFVKADGNGNGSSWSNAFSTLQQAIAQASPGTEIWVAKGIYYPIQCGPCSYNDRSVSFQIPDGVKVYGGFNGDETNINQRDINSNPTILSGDIDQNSNSSNNSFTIVLFQNVSDQTELDGFVLTGGNADWWGADSNSKYLCGGAIYNDGSLAGSHSSPLVRNCTFEENQASTFGGAVYNYGGFSGFNHASFDNCIFENNVAASGGGAMYNNGSFDGECEITITSCHFQNNTTSFNGGAIYNQGSSAGKAGGIVTNCTFIGNSASASGGAVLNFGNNGESSPTFQDCNFDANNAQQGGAVFNDGSFTGKSHGLFINCDFTQNTTTLGGGAVYNLGSEAGASNPTFTNCNFVSNGAVSSGGAFFSNGLGGISNATLTNCVFTANISDEYGGAVYNLGKSGNSSPEITNCMFINNTATAAGAIYNLGSDSGNSSPTVTNCTFYGNQANVGACIYNQANDFSGTCSPIVTNCIAWNNTAISGFGTFFQNGYGSPTISHSLINVSNCNDLNTGINGSVTCGPGLIFNQNPMFADANSQNFHLQSESPAIDKGSNTAINATGVLYDLDSLIRVNNGTVDLGAYEFNTGNYIPPAITTDPTSQIACEGENVSFEILVEGTGPMTFQWKKNGVNIPQANQSSISIAQISSEDTGSYTCQVIGLLGEQLESAAASLSINPNLHVSIAIEASANQICEGQNIEFTTTSQNGGADPTYQWILNGNPIGSNSSSLNIDTLQDGDLISCQLTSSELCTWDNPVISDSLTVSIDAIVQPSVNLTASDTSICEGTSIMFDATGIHAGENPQWEWKVNGQSQGINIEQFITMDLEDGDVVSCQMTSSLNCVLDSVAVSENLEIEVAEVLISIISIDAVTNEICEGQEVTLNSTYENAGEDPFIEWYINSHLFTDSIGAITIENINDGDIINAKLISDYACITNPEQTSNDIQFTVHPNLEVNATITASEESVCDGEEVHFVLVHENGGDDPQLNWFVNGVETGFSSEMFSDSTLNDGDVIICQVISSETCTIVSQVSSNSIEMEINPILQVGASIQTGDTVVCLGQEVPFTIELENGGNNPTFLWQVNGENRSTGSNFIWSNASDGDEVQCLVTSSEQCLEEEQVNSNLIQLSVHDILTPTVEIINPAGKICENGIATLRAISENGGNVPELNWFLNGEPVGTNNNIVELNGLAQGDSIQVILTSSIACVTQEEVLSESFAIDISPWLQPDLFIQSLDTVFCEADSSTFIASHINGGLGPQFRWFRNGIELAEQESEIRLQVEDGDEIFCVLTSSEVCANPVMATSNELILEAIDCTVNTSSISGDELLTLFPNPASGIVNINWSGQNKIHSIKLKDASGRFLKEWSIDPSNNAILDLHFAKQGLYFLLIYGESFQFSKPVFISK